MIELAIPLASGENNSDINSNGIGPNPMEIPKINKQSDINGKKLIWNANWGLWSRIQKYKPNPYNDSIIRIADVMIRILLPSLSINKVDITVAQT